MKNPRAAKAGKAESVEGRRPRSSSGSLSEDERLRYARQIIIPGIGVRGQLKLKKARVLIIGAGGLGSPAAIYLAAAGVGYLGIIDPDRVDPSNLQRQVLHFTGDVGRPKTESAGRKLKDLNPEVRFSLHDALLQESNALETIEPYDVVIDGSDNLAVRYAANDACVRLRKPLIFGSVQHFYGQLGVFWTPRGPCLRCLLPRLPVSAEIPSCAEGGVLATVPGVIGTLQAAEAIKIILGRGTPLVGRILFYDALTASFESESVRRNPSCPACGERPSVAPPSGSKRKKGEESASLSGPARMRTVPLRSITVPELKKRLAAGEKFFFLEIREPGEPRMVRWEGALSLARGDLERRIPEIPLDREVVVLCRIGVHSRDFIRRLRELGYENVTYLAGGTLAWKYGLDVDS